MKLIKKIEKAIYLIKKDGLFNFIKMCFLRYIIYTKFSKCLYRYFSHSINAFLFLMNNVFDSIKTPIIRAKIKNRSNFPLVSIIVPSYNHRKFINKRLNSIVKQVYPNIEIIILDDGSADGSQTILRKFKFKHTDITKLFINNKNSGSVFKQWKKGIELAKGEYIWIAETDDYCSPLFLYEISKGFTDPTNIILFGHSTLINSRGLYITSMAKLLMDTKFQFSKKFRLNTQDMLNKGFGWKNVIVNVSSCVFKNSIGLRKTLCIQDWTRFKLCGDWMFYLNILKYSYNSYVYYSPYARNCYRIHKNGTSIKVQKTDYYINELIEIYKFLKFSFKVDSTICINMYYYIVHEILRLNNNVEKYNIPPFYKKRKHGENKLKILIVIYAFISGGGETFPIYLANQLNKNGYKVAVLNFLPSYEKKSIRNLLDSDIPIIDLNNRDLNIIVNNLNFDIIQTQHAVCDYKIMKVIKNKNVKHIIVNHGMYNNENIMRFDKNYFNKVTNFLYIADKGNLRCIPNKKKRKIINGLPNKLPNQILRSTLSIPKDAFVCCTVSRGIPEKGWSETIEAVSKARENSGKDIHYIIVGSGFMYSKLYKKIPNFIHMVGFSENPRSYILASDLVILASTFEGESFPLLIIDSFQCGKPVLTTDIGETKNMIKFSKNLMAGSIIKTQNNKIDIDDLSKQIIRMCVDKNFYLKCKFNAKAKGNQYSIQKVACIYEKIYKECANN